MPEHSEHALDYLIPQQVMETISGHRNEGICQLGDDNVPALAINCDNIMEVNRLQEHHKDHPLVSQSIFNLLEFGSPKQVASGGYKRTAADSETVEESLHETQEGYFFNIYYRIFLIKISTTY